MQTINELTRAGIQSVIHEKGWLAGQHKGQGQPRLQQTSYSAAESSQGGAENSSLCSHEKKKRGSMQNLEAGGGYPGGIYRHCLRMPGMETRKPKLTGKWKQWERRRARRTSLSALEAEGKLRRMWTVTATTTILSYHKQWFEWHKNWPWQKGSFHWWWHTVYPPLCSIFHSL